MEHHIDIVVGFGDFFGFVAGFVSFLIIRYVWQTLAP